MAFVGLNAAFLVWLERKVAGHIQRRIGPKEAGPFGVLQSFADGIKLMVKQLVVPAKADPILFRLAPALTMITAIMVFVVIPFGPTIVARDLNIGLLLIFAIASINVSPCSSAAGAPTTSMRLFPPPGRFPRTSPTRSRC
jgi:NADH-quinone oxidoreductase subunit H